VGIPGCDHVQRGAISGRVTLDGQPIEEGSISFVPTAAGQDQAASSRIRQGEYSIAQANGPGLGNMRVEIRAARLTGRRNPPSDPALAALEAEYESVETVPNRYNTESELTAEIKPGNNVVDFDLKTK
jgi:hypothetical protein